MNPTDLTLPDTGNSDIGLLLALLDATTRKWRSQLEGVPEAALLWQPFPGGHSIGAILLHIADCEAYWLYEVAVGGTRSEAELAALLSEETDQFAVQWPLPPQEPLAWYYARQDEIRARTRRTLADFDSGDQICASDDRAFTVRWLLHHMTTHEAYHVGQAVLLSLQYERLASSTS